MFSAAMWSVNWIFGLLVAGVLAGLVLSQRPRTCGRVCAVLVAAAAGWSIYLGWLVFASPDCLEITFGQLMVVPSSLTLHFTTLNIMFVWLILGLGLLATIYSVRYVDRVARQSESGPVMPVLRYYPALMLFLASMIAVVSVSDLLFFVVAWGFMSLPAYLLIIHENRKPEVLRAGLKYFLFTSVGNVGILVGVLILYQVGGDFSYESARASMALLLATEPWLAHVAVGMMALGFLTKLGVWPMGDWLPDAHPAAPSPVSALLSGVMIKLGAYDIAHVFFGLFAALGATAAALSGWGLGLAALGGLSVLLGGSAAATNTDTKRLLAYSSVSQSGYILMCLGIAIAMAGTAPAISALAFVAAMVFVIADGMHKSLLFLTAGSALHATGTRDLMRLGGLGEKMPSTAAAAIAGALSVGGIPLTAGFVGKWLLFQSALLGAAQQPLMALYLLVVVVGSILSLAYALKYVGAAYLGSPGKASASADVGEVPRGMRMPQLALVAGCVLAGIWPAVMVRPALAAWQHLPGISAALPLDAAASSGLLVRLSEGALAGGFVAPAVLVLVGVAGLLALGLARLGGAPVREVPVWQSGLELPPGVTRLPASGWYWPFAPVLQRVYPELEVPQLPRVAVPALTEPLGELSRSVSAQTAETPALEYDRQGNSH
ncbi:MAG: complex I subunit 5 family protein, partial [Armatimonadota bacterium]